MEQGIKNTSVLIIVSDMGAGGAQRVISHMTTQWTESGKSVVLVTFSNHEDDFFTISKSVKRVSLGLHTPSNNLWSAVKNNILRIHSIHKVIKLESPDVVMSFISTTNILTILASFGLNKRVVISERSDPSIEDLGIPWQKLRTIFYKFADIVTANSMGALNSMSKYVPESKLKYVRNPLRYINSDEEVEKENIILCVARLNREKGVDVLLDSYASTFEQFPDWKLLIVGNGELEVELKNHAKNLGISSHVIWAGKVKDPSAYFLKSRIFILPSRREGMPNALLEAMSCGLPCIITSASSGPLEIVKDKVTGLVVPNEDADSMSNAITTLIRDKGLRDKLSIGALDAVSKIDMTTVYDEWESLLK
jgi:glycosyltransferase involved in cell wall biosynthesis